MAQINYKPESVTEPEIAKFFFHEKHEIFNFHGRQINKLVAKNEGITFFNRG